MKTNKKFICLLENKCSVHSIWIVKRWKLVVFHFFSNVQGRFLGFMEFYIYCQETLLERLTQHLTKITSLRIHSKKSVYRSIAKVCRLTFTKFIAQLINIRTTI